MEIVHNNNLEQEDEQYVWSELRKGNVLALNCLFNRYYSELYFYGIKLVGSKELVTDSIQDVYANIWETRKKISDVKYIKAYLFTIFRNRLLKYNKIEIEKKSKNSEYKYEEPDFHISPEDIYLDNESKLENTKIINDLLSELSPKQKEIIYLKFYCNYSNIEISKVLSIKHQSVANLLARTIKVLQKKKNDRNLYVLNILISSLL